MRLLIAGLFLCLCLPAEASRAQRHWGGADFPISCQTVREWRQAIKRMSPETRAKLAREFRITKKQRRQAYGCLR